jgi:hypothetical protein
MAGFVALVAVLLAALYVCWLILQPFFNVLLWAAVLSVVFFPMHRRSPPPARRCWSSCSFSCRSPLSPSPSSAS